MIVYITPWRADLFQNECTQMKTLLFHFPNEEMIYLKNRPYCVLPLDYENKIPIELEAKN